MGSLPVADFTPVQPPDATQVGEVPVAFQEIVVLAPSERLVEATPKVRVTGVVVATGVGGGTTGVEVLTSGSKRLKSSIFILPALVR